MTQSDRLSEFFRARPFQWISGCELARVMTGGTGVGTTAIRRIDDLRKKRGMEIRNRKWRVDGIVHSEFQYIPAEKQPALL